MSDGSPRTAGGGVAAGLGTTGGTIPVIPEDDFVPKVETGISGFDHITLGGLTRGRTTLVSGSTGTGKTVFAAQFLCEGVRRGEPGVFVTFEEPAADLRQNFASLGWHVEDWESAELWRFVDASPVISADAELGMQGEFENLIARIGDAVDRTAAERIVLDSLNVFLIHFRDPGMVRHYLRRLAVELRRMRLTVVMTLEEDEEAFGRSATPLGFEHFVADNVVMLRNIREDEKRRRTIEVLKMRGAMHRKGEYPFTVLPGQGFVVIPLSVLSLQRSSDIRVTSGNAALDDLCQGGFFGDSVILASGSTGTGKTLMVTEFMAGGATAGDRSLLFAFEESRDQTIRNARGWGRDFEALEASGHLRIVATYPEVASLEDHLVEMTREMEAFRPARIAIDSLTALQRSGTQKGFQEFLLVLANYVKAEQLAALCTATTPTLLGGPTATDTYVSTLTDSIVLLRYVEVRGEVRRGLTVLKMRGSAHDNRIHEFTIDGGGLHVGEPFRDVAGILAGQPVPADVARPGTA